jgi:hypothetical protein
MLTSGSVNFGFVALKLLDELQGVKQHLGELEAQLVRLASELKRLLGSIECILE